jgi:RND family efflux transporter MFP subunit
VTPTQGTNPPAADLSKLRIERSERPALRRRRRSPRLAPLAGLVLLLAAVVLFRRPLLEGIDRIRLPEVRTVLVERAHPAEAGAVAGTAANGYIVAARRAALSADTPGRIVEMNVEEGTVVEKGAVVARLYDEEYKAALRRAEADLAASQSSQARIAQELESTRAELARLERAAVAAESDVAEAQASLELARIELNRSRELVEGGAEARSRLDAAQAAHDEAVARRAARAARLDEARSAVSVGEKRVSVVEADLEVARAQVRVAEAARDEARATLDKTEIRAPFAGIVVLKDAEVGEVVSPNSQSGSNARGSVATMVDFDSLEAQVEMPETNLAAVRLGAPARVYLDAFPEKPYTGRVDRIWPTANRQKGTVEIRVQFDRPDRDLRPEMGVRVVFVREGEAAAEEGPSTLPAPRALLVPEGCVVSVGGKRGVFALERDRVLFRALDLGERRSGRVAVEAGLEEGERVVLDPPPSLEDGDRVRLRKEE